MSRMAMCGNVDTAISDHLTRQTSSSSPGCYQASDTLVPALRLLCLRWWRREGLTTAVCGHQLDQSHHRVQTVWTNQRPVLVSCDPSSGLVWLRWEVMFSTLSSESRAVTWWWWSPNIFQPKSKYFPMTLTFKVGETKTIMRRGIRKQLNEEMVSIFYVILYLYFD